MQNPSVVRLKYRLRHSEALKFNDPPPVAVSTSGFTIVLDSDIAKIDMIHVYESVEEARRVVEDYLHSWEIYAAIQNFRSRIDFSFERGEIVDRADLPGTGRAALTSAVTMQAAVALSIELSKYPEPPETFRSSWEVEAMWSHYERFLDEREPLLAMAYFCLTVLVWSSERDRPADRQPNGKKWKSFEKTAEVYGIDRVVLKELSKLTSIKGAVHEARKIDSEYTGTPLTQSEAAWIRAVIPTLIRRAGEHSAAPTVPWPHIQMSAFPKT